MNRKLQQKAEKFRVIQEEKEKRKQGKQRDESKTRIVADTYGVNFQETKPLHTLAHDIAA